MLDVKKFYIYLPRRHKDTKYLCDELARIITKITLNYQGSYGTGISIREGLFK